MGFAKRLVVELTPPHRFALQKVQEETLDRLDGNGVPPIRVSQVVVTATSPEILSTTVFVETPVDVSERKAEELLRAEIRRVLAKSNGSGHQG
jgi:hypothetical protein